MTELYIDEQLVAIPPDANFTIKEHNPLITKNGSFSLDITLSLSERNNSIIYKHLERLHNNTTFNPRKAVLIADNRVIVNGSEAIVNNTNEKVTIQLLSGNSELNYFIGSDLYISDLDLGTEQDLTDSYMNSVVDKKYPASSFAPARVKVDAEILNNFTETPIESGWYYSFTNKALQPYLVGMLEKVIKALGYTIIYNQLLDDDFLCRLFFLSNVKSLEYNKHLPGWTAKEFLEECETYFNVVFDINSSDKTVRILRSQAINPIGTFEIDNILDEYTREISQDNELSYQNIQYDFSGSTYYKYADIDEQILKQAVITTFPDYSSLASFVKVDSSYMIPPTEANKYFKTLNMFYVQFSDTYYIVDKYSYNTSGPGETSSGSWYYLRPVNSFRKISNNTDSSVLKLKFIPAQPFFKAVSGSLVSVNVIPYQSEKVEETEEETDLKLLIENGIKDLNSNQKKVCLAIYTGGSDGLIKASAAQMDYVHETVYSLEVIYPAGDSKTLRLSGINGLHKKYYQANSRYDFTKEYTIKFISDKIPDVRADFLFQNKLFACKELEYSITNDGISPVISGTFLPIIH
ncbi:MAG: hypothetical protein ACK5HZ_12315 [Macellibacteroides fermentans]|uniref:hypothetical protein n=1 Tax=Macellibacteroides fermentans TaxID=879969 RepID=UPI003AC527FD